ncbi:hypothetical protein Vafri_18855 [Volvox africanus]|uniref:Uncharacterized protein n=1 Tax=Volvox africanus TaxID=51714 RepID=A0A8J4BQ87_9CHLO|nr:hypothetical protein Vafri_18855 [Volvox africanus]
MRRALRGRAHDRMRSASRRQSRLRNTTVRAFIRNCEHLFSLTSWGSRDGGRCLFLTNALKGKAKEWLDDWAMHRRTYTSAELLLALEARFAPQGLDPEMEDAEVPLLPKRMHTMPAVAVPVAAAAVSDPAPAALGGPSASRRMRVGPPGKRYSVAEYRERQALGACFGCGSMDHQWRLCPENPNAKKGLKASGGVVKHKGSKGPKYRNKGQGKGKGNDA